jgi:hypothetical protein
LAGGQVVRDFAQIRTQAIRVPSAARAAILAAFTKQPSVSRADPTIKLTKASTPDDPGYGQQWALPKIGWDQAYGVVSISGTAQIAVLDTGVDAAHPDLSGRMVVPGYSSLDGVTTGDPDKDPNGHGTALAGIAAATVNNATGIAGVAYDGTSIASVQVLGADGTGTDADVVAGVLWAADHGADVILMGFSSRDYSAALANALSYAWSKGAVLVAATGNDGSSSATYPAGMPNVIGVAATDPLDALVSSSNTGSASVAAPGVAIDATQPGGGYGTISGTSAAAALTAGEAALLVASGKSNSGARDQAVGAADPVSGRSFGRIDVAKALGAPVEPIATPTAGPTPTLTAAVIYEAGAPGDVSITSASGGTNLSVDKAANAASPSFTTLGNIVVAETGNTKQAFAASQTNKTLILTTPTNWAFNPGVGSVSFTGNNDITAASIAVASTTITVTLSTGNGSKIDTLTISGIQVRATNGSILPSAGDIFRLSDAAGGTLPSIQGLTNTTSLGSLSQVAGSPANLSFTTQPTASYPAASATIAAAVKVTDQFNNPVSGVSVSLALQGGSAGAVLSGTTTQTSASTTGIAGFSGLSIQKLGSGYFLRASSGSVSPADSSAFNITVGNSTTNTPTSSVNPSVVGQVVTFTATVLPSSATGTVAFNDGVTVIGTGILSGGSASFSSSTLGLGTHSITATYSGDDNLNGGTSAALSQTVNKRTTTTSVSCDPNAVSADNGPAGAGSTICTATVSDASNGANSAPTGTVGTWTTSDTGNGSNFSPTTCTLSPIAGTTDQASCFVTYNPHGSITGGGTRTDSIRATYTSGDTVHNPSPASAAYVLTVNKLATTTLTVGAATGTSGTQITVTATLRRPDTNAGIASKTISFKLNGNSVGSATTGSVAPNVGVATLTVFLTSDGSAVGTPIATGTYANGVSAIFAGDATTFNGSVGFNTLTVNSSATVPGAPTIGTATAGNGQAVVSFTAPASNGGSPITSYSATSSPGGFTGTGTTSPITVTGLSNGTGYTFTVTATNAVGTGPASAASNSVTPIGVPGAPTIGTATRGDAQATVSFTAPASNGGSAISSYTATSSPGGFTGTGTSSPITVTGLSNGTSYTFTVSATNAVGTGPASAASNSVTPSTLPGAPTIGTAAGGNGRATVSFTAPTNNGGSTITGYRVTSTPGSVTATGSTSPITITGLNNGTSYTFTVAAENANGYGAESSASNAATPSKANQATLTVTGPASGTYGEKLTPTASGGSGTGAVSFSVVSGSTACTMGVGEDSGELVITSGTGTCQITATKAGDADYNSTSSDAAQVTIGKASASLAFVPADLSQTYTGSAKTVGVITNPTGLTGVAVSYKQGDTVVASAINAGSYTVGATLTNDNYIADTIEDTLVVGKANQTITFEQPYSPQTYGVIFNVNPTASSNLVVNVSGTAGVCTVVAATIGYNVTMLTGTGTCTLTASQAGDTNYNTATAASGSSLTRTVTAAKAAQTITFNAPASPQTYNATFNIPASDLFASSGLTVSLVGTTDVCSVALATAQGTTGWNVTMLTGTGTCTLTASQAGDTNYNAATAASGSSLTRTVTASKANQTITFTQPYSPQTYGAIFNVNPTASSNLVVNVSGTAGVCTVVAATIGYNVTMLTGTGTCTLTASQAGDTNYNAASSVARTVTAVTAGTTTSVILTTTSGNPTPQFSDTVTLSATVSANATAAGDGVFSGTVSFQFNGKPSPALTALVSNASPAAQVNLRLDELVIPSGAGTSYPVTATFNPSIASNYGGSASPSQTVAVVKEGLNGTSTDGSTKLDFTGDQYVLVGGTPNLLATFSQRLAPEANDTEFVDFSKVTVYAVISVYPAGCGTTCGTTPTWTSGNLKVTNRSDWSVGGFGYAQMAGPKTLNEGSYLVMVNLIANGYVVAESSSSTLTVASATGTFITGGGFVANDSTSNTTNPKGNFGFNVKNGNNSLQGNAIYIYRMRMNVATSTVTNIVPCATIGGSCKDVDITIRSNKLNALSTGTATTYPMNGYATGQIAVQFVDAADGSTHYTQFEFGGGTFRIDILDNTSGGQSDTYGFTAYRKDGTVFHQATIPASNGIAQTGTGAATNQVTLGGGNIAVHPK